MWIIMELVNAVFYFLRADWWILLIGILIAVGIKVYIDPNKFKEYVDKKSKVSIFGSIGFGAFTPLCACGTMAVLLSMFITQIPWGPVMAFLVSSPITSPSEFVFQSSFFGTEFATVILIVSLGLGLAAGFIANALSKRTNFFTGQFRLQEKCTSCSEDSPKNEEEPKPKTKKTLLEKLKIKEAVTEFYKLGVKKVLLYFVIFIMIGKTVELVIPTEWILSLFGSGNVYSIPLGATIGLPLYVSGSASLPLMKSFLNQGAAPGVILAFLITGKATGVPVIAGMSTILKKRAILFYVSFVYFGGIISGFLYQIYLSI